MGVREIGIEKARKNLGFLADLARYANETTILTRNGHPIAAITPIGDTMDTSKATTVIGDWTTVEPHSTSLEATIGSALGEYAGDHDIPALTAAFRAAIDNALPEGISLNGNQFIGPWGHPYPGDAIREAYASVNFWALAQRHAKS